MHFGFCCLQTAKNGEMFATGYVRGAREWNAVGQALAMPCAEYPRWMAGAENFRLSSGSLIRS